MDYSSLDNIKITTITLCIDIKKKICLDDLETDIIKYINNKDSTDNTIDSHYIFEIKYNKHSKKSIEKSIITSSNSKKIIKEASKGNFYNCLLLKIQDTPHKDTTKINKYSIKFFKNGLIHITGLKDEKTEQYLLNMISILVKNTSYYKKEYIMINGIIKFKNNSKIILNIFQKNISEETDSRIKYSTYNPEHYPGLVVKTIIGTIIIFSTGTIMLSSNSFDNIVELKNIAYKIYE